MRATTERLLRGIYTRMPFGWEFRLRVKDWIFRSLGPLLARTQAYRRWKIQADIRTAAKLANEKAVRPQDGSALGRYVRGLLGASSIAAGSGFAPLRATQPPGCELGAKAIAFYLPQFHPIEQNDKWWGRGFTEWTNVSKALPQFVGHYQPHLPGELGFYDLRLVEVMHRQVELAKLHGIHGFCFHHYWFSGQRLLERPLDQFLSEGIDFPFCLCWANESWTRRWDGNEQDVLMGQVYDDGNDDAFIRDLLPYLRDQRYIRIDGRPLLIVYRPSLLPDCARTLLHWRDYCRKAGVGEIFLAMVQYDVHDPRVYGFDAALEFPPHKLAAAMPSINHLLEIVNPDYTGRVLDYNALVQRAQAWPAPEFPQFRGVFPGWDNEARKPGGGYTFANSTPQAYRKWLTNAVSFARAHPVAGESVVFINAWNEWAEGAHLEPDRKFGYAYLQATRDALTSFQPRTKVLLVVHDAQPHGAQYLALHQLREMREGLHIDVEVLLLGPGPLLPEFERLAPVHQFLDPAGEGVAELAARLHRDGFELALINTVVSGRAARTIRDAGMKVVSLVHELPGLIADYGLERELVDIIECSEHIVVASEAVRIGLASLSSSPRLEQVVRVLPQGLFVRSKHRGVIDHRDARRRLHEKLRLPPDASLVLAVGYADRRKGLDLLVSAAEKACLSRPDLHVAWVGHHDEALLAQAMNSIRMAGLESRFHFVGPDFATDDYYAGADLYALASREDPFPSVVLESLSVGTPVLAFAGTGGGADLLARGGGLTVPAFDVDAYAAAMLRLLGDDVLRKELGESGRRLVDAEFGFRAYMIDLLNLGGCGIPRVSVVVPNFNYSRYLEQRLQSIATQMLPVYEIIVLDDASTDDSLQRLQQLRGSLDPEPRIVARDRNGGSVFRQWLRGVELARGDFVWIAEADDLCSPDFLETIVPEMQQDPSIVLGYCQSRQIDGEGRVLADDYLAWTDDVSLQRWRSRYVASGREEVAAGLSIKNTIPNVSAVVFRRDCLREVLGDNIDLIASHRIAGDWIAYLKLLQDGRVLFDPNSCNQHRRHEASMVAALDPARHLEEVLAAQRLAGQWFALDGVCLQGAKHYADRLKLSLGLANADA